MFHLGACPPILSTGPFPEEGSDFDGVQCGHGFLVWSVLLSSRLRTLHQALDPAGVLLCSFLKVLRVYLSRVELISRCEV